ncbi:MAG: FAD-dependent oxidoreductase [Betaproteobacteria bacterium]|nr:FAD-dependent oxidoreductase [Betaproteobacteria bacterium]
MNNATSHIAIVGAGMAGLSCAFHLQTRGLETSVFDKSGGPSGRMSTRLGDDWQCDHGAPYFTARHPDFRAEVTRWQQAGVAGLWEPRLQLLGEQPLQDPDQALDRFVGVPRMTAPAHLLAKDLALTPHSTIHQVQRRADGWHLLSAEQGWLGRPFDSVLVALPAPQAAPLLQQCAPALASVADRANMRGCWALMLRFAAALDLPFDAAIVNQGPLRWVARDSSKPGRSGIETWVLHASADWSSAHLEQDADWVAAALLQAFGELGTPAPQAWTVHRWRYAGTAHPLNQGCIWDATHNLGLCGDWLNDGTVEGAWLSGRQLAQHVLRLNTR